MYVNINYIGLYLDVTTTISFNSSLQKHIKAKKQVVISLRMCNDIIYLD